MEKLDKILALRNHPSFGMVLTPLISLLGPHGVEVPALPNQNQTGTLTSVQISTLYTIAIYPVTSWSLNPQYNSLDLPTFSTFVNLKTNQTPSYFTAYNETLILFQALVQQMGQSQALNYLYTPNPSKPPLNWDIVRNWVIQEFLYTLITSGNFRTYGWVNYPGWMGGPYNNPNKLPYRV